MTGPRPANPAIPADHPLRAALADSERLRAASASALQHLLPLQDRTPVSEAVVAQVSGMIADLAVRVAQAATSNQAPDPVLAEALGVRLQHQAPLRAHCHALALEWRLTLQLEAEIALDPVLAPALSRLVAEGDEDTSALAVAGLAAQARFAQAQRRMQMPLEDLPAELFHGVLTDLRAIGGADAASAEAVLRSHYDEAASRLTLLARAATLPALDALNGAAIEEVGVALWLSVLAARSGEERDTTAFAAADATPGRLLLTLRAAGLPAAEAERQVLRVQPDAELPRGLEQIGTREAAQWLAEFAG